MNLGDIIALKIAAGKQPRYADAKLIEIVEDEQIGIELFGFEFIAGPLDGDCVLMTRRDLDQNQGRTGGDEWKGL